MATVPVFRTFILKIKRIYSVDRRTKGTNLTLPEEVLGIPRKDVGRSVSLRRVCSSAAKHLVRQLRRLAFQLLHADKPRVWAQAPTSASMGTAALCAAAVYGAEIAAGH